MITLPFTFTDEQAKLVNSYNSDRSIHDAKYWSSSFLESLKSEIKSHYITQQGFKCCFCNIEIRTNHGRVWDTEHIVARSARPDFMFEPTNLAASCIDCNTSKGTYLALTNKNIVNYPNGSSSFKIIHPHFDEFDDHIRVYLNNIYTAKSLKGQRTIEVCGLLRYGYVHVGMEDSFISDKLLREKSEQLMNAQDPDQITQLTREIVIISQVRVSKSLFGSGTEQLPASDIEGDQSA